MSDDVCREDRYYSIVRDSKFCMKEQKNESVNLSDLLSEP